MGESSTDGALPHLVLLRVSGDVSTKARPTRQRFIRRLVQNLHDALDAEGVDAKLRSRRDRLFIEASSPRAAEVAARVFGIQSVSLVERRPAASLDDVVRAGAALFRDAVAGRSFRVRARRVGDRGAAPFGSRALERELGTALLAGARRVDLTRPDVTAHVELFEGHAYFFPDVVKAQGGLPLGVEGRAVALASGGFDSAVAAWLLQKRGVALDYVFCNLGGATHQQGVLRVLDILAGRWSYGTRPRLHVVDFECVSANLQERAARRYWQVLLKRLMLRAAELVALERGATAIVTGDAVGQVSSQTLQNLAVISQATAMPILRPLVGFNKEEIIDRARAIGTYELSAVVDEYCAMVPRRPATAATLEAVEAEERKLDPDLPVQAVAARGVFDLRALDLDALELPEIEIDHVPRDAAVLDLRSREAFRGWHYPGALQLDFPHALRAYTGFDRSRTWVLYCEFGLKSAHLAEQMRGAGFRAFHVRGGLKRVLAHARERSLAASGLLGPVAFDD